MGNKAMSLPDSLSSGERSTERGDLTLFLVFMFCVILTYPQPALQYSNCCIEGLSEIGEDKQGYGVPGLHALWGQEH